MAAPQYDPKCGSFLSVALSGQAFRPTTSEALTLTPPTTDSLGHHHVPSHPPMLPPDKSGSTETRINTALSHPTHPAPSNTSHPALAVNPSVSRRLMFQWLEHKKSKWDSLDREVQVKVDQAEYMLVEDRGCIKLDNLFICSTGETFAGPSDRQWGTNQSAYRRIHIRAPRMVGAILSGVVQTNDLPTMSEEEAQCLLSGVWYTTRDRIRGTPRGRQRGIHRSTNLKPGSSRGSVDRHRAT